jgi:hypothetical protein
MAGTYGGKKEREHMAEKIAGNKWQEQRAGTYGGKNMARTHRAKIWRE